MEYSMKLFTRIAAPLVAITLVGCSSTSDDIKWRPFEDLDASTQYATFSEIISFQNGTEHKEYVAYKAKFFGELKSRETLGTLYPLGKADSGNYMGTIFLLNGKSLNPHNKDDIALLKQSKEFDFYEFGNMILGHTKFKAKQNICKDFNNKNGVELLMATNYYPENSFTDYYTSLITVKLNNKQVLGEINYQPILSGENTRLLDMLSNEEQKNGKKVAVRNFSEKASILSNIICK